MQTKTQLRKQVPICAPRHAHCTTNKAPSGALQHRWRQKHLRLRCECRGCATLRLTRQREHARAAHNQTSMLPMLRKPEPPARSGVMQWKKHPLERARQQPAAQHPHNYTPDRRPNGRNAHTIHGCAARWSMLDSRLSARVRPLGKKHTAYSMSHPVHRIGRQGVAPTRANTSAERMLVQPCSNPGG